MPKENSKSKCREWEKERRNRLNEAFVTLCKLLPCYDPAINTSKIDVLRNAATYIEELQNKIKELISTNNDDSAKKVKVEEFKKLQERIKRLLGKNEQLCVLLREAKITIPPGCAFVRRIKNPLSWSNRILPEQAKILQKKELEKENNASTKKLQNRKFTNQNKSKVGVQSGTPKHRKAILNRPDPKKLRPGAKKKKTKPLPPSKCVIVLSQPSISQSCYVITNAPSNNNILGNTSTVITNSGLITNPLVSSKTAKTVSSISSLGPGTLILANGTIMPVIPQQTVLASQIITNPLPLSARPPIILVPRNPVSVQSTSTTTTTSTSTTKIVTTGVKTLARIKPKYCLTKTTQVNKVPIPALTSRYANNDIINKSEAKTNKSKPVSEKKATAKEAEKKTTEPEIGEKRKLPENTDSTDAKKAKSAEDAKKPEKPEAVETSKDKPAEAKTIDKPEEAPKVPKITEQSKVTPKTSEAETKKADDSALELNINHSELSNDIFATLQVPTGCQNPESTSPTAAFLLAFPLVSSLTGVKVTEVTEEDNPESQRGTPTLLQIGTMDTTKPTQSESLTPSLLNLDNLSFFSSKDISGFYNSFESSITTSSTTPSSSVKTTTTSQSNLEVQSTSKKIDYQPPQQHQQQQEKNNLVACFGNRNILPSFSANNNNNSLEQQINYQMKPRSSSSGKNIETKQACANYTPQKSFNQCNSFSETPKVSTTCSYANPIKSYPEPLYTNSNTYSYSYPADTNFNQNYYKNITKNDNNRSYYPLNYENYSDYRKSDSTNTHFSSTNYYTNPNYSKDKFNHTNNSKVKNGVQSRPPINWMTDNRPQADYGLPQFSKESDFSHNSIYTNSFTNTQTTYFNTNPVYPSNTNEISSHQEPRKSLDLALVPPVNTYQRNEVEENQFSWSPTKIPQFLDPPHSFVSSTLPTLVGDLALGNPLSFNDQKTDKCQKKETNSRRMKTYEGNNNQSNFLSVSQLVDHNKNESVPARTTTRRNSGNRSTKKAPPPPKSSNQRKDASNKVEGAVGKQMKQQVYSSVNATKNTPSSYSAEALIGGHQMHNSDVTQKRQNYNSNKPISVTSFLHDNILPYFPTVDLPQDNSYMQQNQNYQPTSFGHNFPSTFQNNSYTPNTFIPTATTITSSYNFIADMAPAHDYTENLNLFPSTNKDKSCNKNLNRNVRDQQNLCPGTPKKSKRKHSNDLPNFVDFPFLSMPGSINSPILPDDFHTHTGFLQPPTPQLYPCKNPFTKQNDLTSGSLLPLPPVPVSRSNIQHPEISPSINSAGTSLTNFNLSTIFPEINNKSALSDPYLEPRIKEHSSRSYSSTVQVSFNDKPTLSFSYINSTSQSYNNQ